MDLRFGYFCNETLYPRPFFMILAMMFFKRSQPVWRVTPKTLIALCSYAELGLRIEWRIEVWGFGLRLSLERSIL